MPIESAHVERVLLGLEGLIPLVWLERVRAKCADTHHPTREELWPTDAERKAVTEVLVVADGLATGRPSKGRGELAALAKAIVMLAVAPGGVKVFGRRWEVRDGPRGVFLHQEPV